MTIRGSIRRVARRVGYDIVRYDGGRYNVGHPLGRRMRLVADRGIDVLLDVGACDGGYARGMRALGFRGRIVSFEPVSTTFQALERAAAGDDTWSCENVALGAEDGSAQINVAGNAYSSSLLPMLPRHLASAPKSRYVGTETVQVRRLDGLFPRHCSAADRVFLKIDAQGYERHILLGARDSLAAIRLVQVEASLVPLYEGETLLCDMIAFMGERSFAPVSLEPGFADAATGQLLQTDVIFARATA